LSSSIIKSILPTGHLYTYEFNENRVIGAREDFRKLGFAPELVTVTHRDVLSEGFLLKDKEGNKLMDAEMADAVFLDLPSPEKAQDHAYKVLKHKGRVCNFSPCIEQVQKAARRMAELGFYDIRTVECLSRELSVKSAVYKPIKSKQKEEQKPSETEQGKKF
jgi:tRNA (adenine57-N1/adenine58-N1)-methyltransferase catalytic subunit